jgi:medium-chain acyl-[acyl-carrier-protein] hydrolase
MQTDHCMTLSDQWIIRPRKRPKARFRLYCFPHSGVGSSAFRGWPDELTVDADVEVCLVQLPGREGRLRESLSTSIATLVPALVENMSPLLDRPFAFYGHSLGATIAFETALNIRRNFHMEPIQMFVGASPAPQLPWGHSPLRSLPEDVFLSEMRQRYGALPQEILSDEEMRALALEILRADFTMIETYVYSPQAPLDCNVTVFGGLQDQMVTPQALQAWRHQTSGRFRIQMLDGDHLFLRSCRAELLKSIADELKLCCEKQEAY